MSIRAFSEFSESSTELLNMRLIGTPKNVISFRDGGILGGLKPEIGVKSENDLFGLLPKLVFSPKN